MSLRFYAILLLISGITISHQHVAYDDNDERPFLRIVAPKFICNDNRSNRTKALTNNTLTITLQTREGQKLRYEIFIDFKMLDGFKDQRHTLSIWKNIRLMQQKFHDTSNEISLKNQIEIDALELTSQAIYTFTITGYDERNQSSLPQNFTITYKGNELKALQPNLGDGVSLLLFGSDFFYDDDELLVVAEVQFCDPITDYKYRWDVSGLSSDEGEYFNVTGSSLKIPVGILRAGDVYEIIVAILNKESLMLASTSLKVKIISKELQVQNAPSECLIGSGREISFQVFLNRQIFAKDIQVEWTCDPECSLAQMNGTQQMATFSSDGFYQLKSQLSIGGITKISSTKIGVDSKVIPHVQMKFFPSQPINVMQSNEFIVTVMDLIPKCVAFWNIIAEDEFGSFKDGTALIDIGFVVIKDYEEYFLNELVDYDNNTISKDVTLMLPENVLMSDLAYKFRLSIICPEPITDSSISDRNNVTSFYDIIITTNGPPDAQPLIIKPNTGTAMKTRFKFTTGAAKDSSIDFPLKYSFGYKVNEITIVIASFYENMVTHSQLPYSDSIETFVEVCDINGACVSEMGPQLISNVSYSYSSNEFEFKLKEIEGDLGRGEYGNALNDVVILLLTKRNTETNGTVQYENDVLRLMKNELNKIKLLSESATATFPYLQQMIEFVKMSRILMRFTSVVDESFVDGVLSLTNVISKLNRSKRAIVSSQNYRTVMNHNKDYMQNVLSLSEMLLVSQNKTVSQREKGKFAENVHQFVIDLCQRKNLNSELIETKFTKFQVSKVFSKQLSNEVLAFPGEKTASIIFAPNVNLQPKYLCVATIHYMMDMSDEVLNKMPVYEVMIIDPDDNSNVLQTDAIGSNFLIDLSVTSNENMTCFMLIDGQWNSEMCDKQDSKSIDHVVCKCKTGNQLAVKTAEMMSKPISPTVATEKTSLSVSTAPTHFSFLSTRTTQALPVFVSVSSSESSTALVTTTPESKQIQSTMTNTFSIISNEINKKSSTEAMLTTQVPEMKIKSTEKSLLTSENVLIFTNSTQSNATSENSKQISSSSTSWMMIGLLLGFLALIIVLVAIQRCRQSATRSHVNLPMRTPAMGIHYAKFQDEHNLMG